MLSSFSSQKITTLANEIQKEKILVADISKPQNNESEEAMVKIFDLLNTNNIEEYNKVFKVER